MLVENLPAARKFGMIFELLGQYLTEDEQKLQFCEDDILTHRPEHVNTSTAVEPVAVSCLASGSSLLPPFSETPLTCGESPPAAGKNASTKLHRVSPVMARQLRKVAVRRNSRHDAFERKARVLAEEEALAHRRVMENTQWLPH